MIKNKDYGKKTPETAYSSNSAVAIIIIGDDHPRNFMAMPFGISHIVCSCAANKVRNCKYLVFRALLDRGAQVLAS